MCKLTMGEAEELFVTYLMSQVMFSKQELTSLTWEANMFSQEEVDEEMFPPHLLETLPDTFLLSCAMEVDEENLNWLFSIVERGDDDGYIGWAICQDINLGSPPVWIRHDGTVLEMEGE
ncbi:hypothetical protein [Salipaludibacillus sp. CF4.18]|uniref:hypothetical protein n=1 Tax=Salipaludibacillus sp. CF4.18 TaxID=3373081 RepID=UPI003EE4BB6C